MPTVVIATKRISGLPAAAVDADAAAGQRRSALGSDVNDAGRMQAVLSRQRAGDQLHAADEGGLENSASKPETPSGSRIPLIRY